MAKLLLPLLLSYCSYVVSFHVNPRILVGNSKIGAGMISSQKSSAEKTNLVCDDQSSSKRILHLLNQDRLRKQTRHICFALSMTDQNKHAVLQSIQNTAYQSNNFKCGMKDIADNYDAFLLDQWGVLHDGTKAYDGAINCLNELLSRGKLIVLLSNSSKRLGNSMKKLDAMGIQRYIISNRGFQHF